MKNIKVVNKPAESKPRPESFTELDPGYYLNKGKKYPGLYLKNNYGIAMLEDDRIWPLDFANEYFKLSDFSPVSVEITVTEL